MNHSPPPFSFVDFFLLQQCYSLKSPLLSCFCFCHFAKERGKTEVKKNKKEGLHISIQGYRFVESEASSLAYSLKVKPGTEEHKYFNFFFPGFAFGSISTLVLALSLSLSLSRPLALSLSVCVRTAQHFFIVCCLYSVYSLKY